MKRVERVGVIEDELDYVDLIRRQLSMDYDVVLLDETPSPESLLSIDFVVLDVQLTVTHGQNVYDTIRTLSQRCAVVVYTSLPAESEEVEWFRAKNVKVFHKDTGVHGLDELKFAVDNCRFEEACDMRVLLIDDLAEARAVYSRALLAVGFQQVIAVESVDRAVIEMDQAHKAGRHFAMIFVDTFLTDATGRLVPVGEQFATKLAEDQQDTAVFIFSTQGGQPQPEQRARLRRIDIESRERLDAFILAAKLEIERGPYRHER